MREDLQFVRGYLLAKELIAGPILSNGSNYYFFVQKRRKEANTAMVSIKEGATILVGLPLGGTTSFDLHDPDSLIKIYMLIDG